MTPSFKHGAQGNERDQHAESEKHFRGALSQAQKQNQSRSDQKQGSTNPAGESGYNGLLGGAWRVEPEYCQHWENAQ